MAMSLAEMAAVSCVLLTNVVGRLEIFQSTTELETKPLPTTLKVKLVPPVRTLEGERPVKLGLGLLIVKERALEIPPPGVGSKTVIRVVPTLTMSLAEIAAVNCVLLTNVVGRLELFQSTTELETKPLPTTLRVKYVPPTRTLEGERAVRRGLGL